MPVWNYKPNEVDKLEKHVQKDPTIVMTKPEMAKYIIGEIKIPEGSSVMEPCRGDGAFYDNFPEGGVKYWCEINDGVDFLDCKQRVDYIISNPPFVPRKLFWQFQLKAMELCDKEIHWLINMSSLNVFTPKRLTEMKNQGWFINSFLVVQDCRWFGRYVVVKITKNDNGFFRWNCKNY